MIATGLAFDLTRLVALCAALTIFGCFAVYILLVLLNVFERIPCSCAAVFRSLGWNEHLYINLAVVVLAGWAIPLERKREILRNSTL